MRQWIGLSMILCACGGGDPPAGGGECEAGAVASTDSYLPFSLGNVWRYRVTDEATGMVTTKRQEYTAEMSPPGGGGPGLVQLTTKGDGSTESLLQLVGDAQVRLNQIDYDGAGVVERTTDYTPGKIRIDESPDRIVAGASYMEVYSSRVVDDLGVEQTVEVTESWRVLGVDVPCSSPLSDFECLQIQRTRVGGGVADKVFFYARGVGKIREEGGQTEELLGCTLN